MHPFRIETRRPAQFSQERIRWLAAVWAAHGNPSSLNLAHLKAAEAAYCAKHATQTKHPLRADLLATFAA